MLSKGGGVNPSIVGAQPIPPLLSTNVNISYIVCVVYLEYYIYRRLKGYFRQKHMSNYIIYKYIYRRADRYANDNFHLIEHL